MATTTAPSANYYDLLGVGPGATAQDIERAFAQQMHGFRPMADMARIGLAFATLRDAAKRRAYDEQIGIRRARQAAPAVTAVSFRLTAPYGAPARATAPIAERPEESAAAIDEPAFIAASVKEEPKDRHVRDDAKPDIKPAPAQPDSELDRLLGQLQQLRSSNEPGTSLTRDESGRFNPTVIAVAGLLVGTVAVGVWAGASAQDSEPAAAAPPAATSIALPPAKPAPPTALSAPEAFVERPAAVETHQVPPARSPRIAAKVAEVRSKSPPTLVDVAERSVPELAGEELASATAPAAATTASLPLSNAVIARTIDRIGYSCGRVASTSAVEGAPAGTYMITCTSGQSYQAKPVRGRYRFSRMKG